MGSIINFISAIIVFQDNFQVKKDLNHNKCKIKSVLHFIMGIASFKNSINLKEKLFNKKDFNDKDFNIKIEKNVSHPMIIIIDKKFHDKFHL